MERTVTALQIPLKSLATTLQPLNGQSTLKKDDVILVGQSLWGAVITEAEPETPKSKDWCYVAAFAPMPGETLNGLIERFSPSSLGTR